MSTASKRERPWLRHGVVGGFMVRFALSISIAVLAGISFAQTPKPPNGTPAVKLFAEGIISTGKEFTVTFSPDGNDVYFTRADVEKKINHVMHSRKKDGTWQAA